MKRYMINKFSYLVLGLIFSIHMSYLEAQEQSYPDEVVFAAEVWEGAVNPDGSGLYLDVLKAIYEPVGIDVRVEIQPIRRAFLHLGNGTVDAILGTFSQEYRGDNVLITPKYPLELDKTVAITSKESDLTWLKVLQRNRIGTPDSPAPYSIAWTIGYQYDEFFEIKKGYKVKDLANGLKMVASQHIDVYIDSLDVVEAAQVDYPAALYEKLRWEVIDERNIYVGFGNNPRAIKLCKVYDQRISKLFKTGLLKSVYKKWGRDIDVELNPFSPHGRKVFCAPM